MNHTVLIGMDKGAYAQLKGDVLNEVFKNPETPFISVCDNFLIDFYKKGIEYIRDQASMKSPIGLIQRMFRLKIAEKNVQGMKDN